jgi:arsenite-transporting ATPase
MTAAVDAHVWLADSRSAAFYFVVLPEAMTIAAVTRFIRWFKNFGTPVDGVLVNMVIDAAAVLAGD